MPTTYEYKCNNAGDLEAILLFLEKRGWKQVGDNQTPNEFFEDYPFLALHTNARLIVGNRSPNRHPSVTLAEIFAGKLEAPKCVAVELNSSYLAKVTSAGIEVGCQTFPLSIVANLAAAVKEVSGE